jgi:hypothetical protein
MFFEMIRKAKLHLAATFKSIHLAWLLVVIGCLGPFGYLIDSKPIKGLALAWMVSPIPIVFSDANGFEAFAAKFEIELTLKDGSQSVRPISFKEASKLRGPYNRRNVFGAAIGYAPRLPLQMVVSVLRYGLCAGGPLVEEFELPSTIENVALVIHDGTKGRESQNFRYEVTCQI